MVERGTSHSIIKSITNISQTKARLQFFTKLIHIFHSRTFNWSLDLGNSLSTSSTMNLAHKESSYCAALLTLGTISKVEKSIVGRLLVHNDPIKAIKIDKDHIKTQKR